MNKPKFKVGDNVRVISCENGSFNRPCACVGKVGIVVRTNARLCYPFELSGSGVDCGYSESELKRVSKETHKAAPVEYISEGNIFYSKSQLMKWLKDNGKPSGQVHQVKASYEVVKKTSYSLKKV